MYSIYLYVGTVLVSTIRADLPPSEGTMRTLMQMRSADRGEVYERFEFMARYT